MENYNKIRQKMAILLNNKNFFKKLSTFSCEYINYNILCLCELKKFVNVLKKGNYMIVFAVWTVVANIFVII